VTGQRMVPLIADIGLGSSKPIATYQWDNEGKMTGMTYPGLNGGNGLPSPTMGYQFDPMARLNGMTDSTYYTTAASAAYGPAGELTSAGYYGYSETRTYNSLLQVTRITVAGAMDMEYRYTAGQNNGRIHQSKDYITGEEVTYTVSVRSWPSSASANPG